MRGDCNTDLNVDISDVIFKLSWLFQGGPTPTCLDACDANDDEVNNIADCIYVLNYLFLGGPPPPFPFPGCGCDPLPPGALDCVSHPCPGTC